MGNCGSKADGDVALAEQRASGVSRPLHTNSVTKNQPYNRAKDRVESIDKPKTIELNGLQLTYAYVSQRGAYPDEPFKANQDAYVVKQGLVRPNDALFGVFDGHGKDGDGCAQFARDNLPSCVQGELSSFDSAHVRKDQMHDALTRAHVKCNQQLHDSPTVDDSLSGTTAISLYFHGVKNRITIANLGDSRAVLGKSEHSSESARVSLKALPLSRDQTPYRQDEKIRIKKTGARVLSLDQLEGLEPIESSEHDNEDPGDELVLGDELDEGGDPPRVWHPTEDYPGTAFTRSIGDHLAEELGVYAEPELLSREIQPDDKLLVLASDGVYEFLTNQSVIDICAKFSDPLSACQAVVAESYELWLQYELRTDDITVICIFIDDIEKPSNNKPPLKRELSTDSVDDLEVFDQLDQRPVRKNISKEKSKAIEKSKNQNQSVSYDDDEILDLQQLMTPKTAEETSRIADAIKASVMFRNVTDEQRQLIFACMESIPVSAGTWIIRQNTVGDRFYIIDDGKFEVRIVPDGETDTTGQGGNIVHCYQGNRETKLHPSFGELALMHSAPRSASIIAQTDGHLWALHRSAFRQILVQSQDHRKELKKALKKMSYFSHLNDDGINKLSTITEDVTFGRGDNIVEQGRKGHKLYIIESGSVYASEMLPGETKRSTLKAGNCFGTEVLSSDVYTTTVMALQTTNCWMVDSKLVHKTMGPLLQK